MSANLLITIKDTKPNRFFIRTDKDVDMFGWETISKHESYYMDITPWNLIDLMQNKDKLGINVEYDPLIMPIIENLRAEVKIILEAKRFKTMPQEQIEAIWDKEGFPVLFPKVTVDLYQKRTVLWLLEVKKGGCYLEQGLGKTLIGILVLGKLLFDQKITKPLVMAPLALLSDTVWYEELKVFSDLKPIKLRDDDHFYMPNGDIYFLNPEKLQSWCFVKTDKAEKSYDENNFFEMMKFDAVYLDESTVLKNNASYRSMAFLNINKYIKYLALASGVPAPNQIFQIFTQMKAIGSVLGDSYSAFEQRYGYLRSVGMTKKYFPHAKAESEIRKRIDPVVFFIKRDTVIQLPKRWEIEEEVDLHPEHQKLYEKIEKDYVAAIKGFDEDGNKIEDAKAVIKHEAAVRIKLLQILNGFINITDDHDRVKRITLPWNAKLDKLDELITKYLSNKESNAIIWCRFRWEIETIYNMYKDKYNATFLYGGMGNKREENALKWKNDPTCRIMVALPRTAKFGFTWLKADHSIYFSGTEDYEDYAQSRDRNHRRGQTKEVTETRIITKKTIERRVWYCITAKKKLDRYLKSYYIGLSNE